MSSELEKLKGLARGLTWSEVRELKELGLGNGDLSPEQIDQVLEKTLGFVFPAKEWHNLTLGEARDLCIHVWRLTLFQHDSGLDFRVAKIH